MVNDSHTNILRRMTSPQTDEVAQSPLTTSRAVRMALTKAAHEALELVVTVTGIEESVQPLDEMLAGFADDLMMVDLQRQAESVGLIAVDMQMRAAVLELQTIGHVAPKAPEIRAATSTDKQLSDPLLRAFLQELHQSVAGTEFEGWLDGLSHHNMVPDIRSAALILEDRDYRVLRVTLDLGLEGRVGNVVIALPLSAVVVPPELPAATKLPWDPAFRQAVSTTASVFDVELHRFQLALSQAENLRVGQVLPLPGCTVSSARLVSMDGKIELPAKLGQIGGNRAVRIEQAPSAGMDDLGALTAVQPMQAAPQFDAQEPLMASPMGIEPAGLAMDIEPAGLPMDIEPSGIPMDIEPSEVAIDIETSENPLDVGSGEIATDINIAEPEPLSFELPE